MYHAAKLMCLGIAMAFAMLVTLPGTAGLTIKAERGLAPAEVKPDKNRKVALVIGVDEYRVHPLSNPARDARAMAKVLAGLGFQVVTEINPVRTKMQSALKDFEKRIAGSGVGLFYFAGHGIQMDGRNHLIPKDTNMREKDQVVNNSITLDEVMETLTLGNPVTKIVILDACRNNPFDPGQGGGDGLARVEAPRESLIAYATAPGKFAKDGKPNENGVYTGHLLKALRQAGLKIEDVFKITRASVAQDTHYQQLPWESTSLTADLILLPGAASDQNPKNDPQAQARSVLGGLLRKAPAKLEPYAEFAECERCPKMVVVPAGSFTMGSPVAEAGRQAHEGPQREVRIARPFAVGKFEVTFDEWEACLLDGGCGRWPRDQGWGRGKRPVIDVSWDDARQYVTWLNKQLTRQQEKSPAKYRLLSEAEWEYVARAGTLSARPWGATLGAGSAACADCGNDDAKHRSVPVGTFKPNAWGVADALGNVWEWVADCRNADYQGAPTDASARLTGDCAQRGIRGGSWLTAAKGVRSAARGFYPTQRRDINIGFRVATDIDR